ncbi:MAG: GvpL/GvpF family gas vesicle protein [Pseudomonadota bacterium]
MTALLLHGFAPRGTPRPAQAPKHLRLPADTLVALATPTALDPTSEKAATAAALAHNAVLVAYADGGDVLPVRFGAVFSGVETLIDHVAEAAEDYRSRLDRIQGQVEFGLQIQVLSPMSSAGETACGQSGPGGRIPSARTQQSGLETSGDDARTVLGSVPGDLTPPGAGRAFLARRRDRRDARARAAEDRRGWTDALVRQLAPHVTALSASEARPDRLVDLALLVPRATASTFSTQFAAKGTEAAALGLRLVLSGPWPAYSFCAGDPHGTEDRGPAQEAARA